MIRSSAAHCFFLVSSARVVDRIISQLLNVAIWSFFSWQPDHVFITNYKERNLSTVNLRWLLPKNAIKFLNHFWSIGFFIQWPNLFAYGNKASFGSNTVVTIILFVTTGSYFSGHIVLLRRAREADRRLFDGRRISKSSNGDTVIVSANANVDDEFRCTNVQRPFRYQWFLLDYGIVFQFSRQWQIGTMIIKFVFTFFRLKTIIFGSIKKCLHVEGYPFVDASTDFVVLHQQWNIEKKSLPDILFALLKGRHSTHFCNNSFSVHFMPRRLIFDMRERKNSLLSLRVYSENSQSQCIFLSLSQYDEACARDATYRSKKNRRNTVLGRTNQE